MRNGEGVGAEEESSATSLGPYDGTEVTFANDASKAFIFAFKSFEPLERDLERERRFAGGSPLMGSGEPGGSTGVMGDSSSFVSFASSATFSTVLVSTESFSFSELEIEDDDANNEEEARNEELGVNHVVHDRRPLLE